MQKDHRYLPRLILYYGILQSLHLLILIRAGLLLLSGQLSPFPILPPPNGWEHQVRPFMFGLAGMDVIGILLALIFTYQMLLKGTLRRILGLLSLTIFISGAMIFAIGTVPTGAWQAHPIAYGLMSILFLPTIPLYVILLKPLLKPS